MKTRNTEYQSPQMEIICLETEQYLLVQSSYTEEMFEDMDDFSDFFE